MKHFSCTLLLSLGLVGVVQADPSINEYFTTLSGVQDTSNLWNGFGHTGYGFSCTTSSADPAFYINSIQITPGSGWNSNITFDIASMLGNGFVNNDYTLGTAMGIGQTYYWSDVLNHNGAFSSVIPTGTYSFDASFLGGTSASATNTLYSKTFQVEIVNKIDATVGISYDTSVISPGGTSTVSATLHNNMARDFVSSTWFLTGQSSGSDQLSWNFVGDWFDKTVVGGGSRTDLHSTHTAAADQPSGTYTGSNGIVGGLYNGDQFYFGTDSNTNILVVPEPSSVAVLLIGAIGIFCRRRRN